MVRDPAVCGQFYPGERESLLRDLDKMIPERSDKIDAIGAVSPHAGYMYSGAVAGEVYARLKPRRTYIVLSPNHSGYGVRFASCAEAWRTPLGDIDVDGDILSAMKSHTNLIEEDKTAHVFEHSIEVQLPFIQKTAPSAKIVPLTVKFGNLSELQEVSEAIVSAVAERKRDTVIISSSDMTHYESRRSASRKDKMAIQKVLELDPEGLFEVVERNNISMCGYIPTVMMLMCARGLNAEKAELIKYADSGDVTGDTQQVVGYAGIIVY
ncbi:MAG: AmmeMemoRadiSam system protein B [Candidatus Omnitrophota bacterium]|nr:AmmeMemoRadiSam system protein B [Candidatus Omnitrophota bacterium]